MANGFLPGLLLTSKQVFQGANPSTKITPPGYLKMLLANGVPNIVSSTIDDGSGHIRDVKIKYRPRTTPGHSGTVDDCSIQASPVYKEMSIPALSFRKVGIFIDYATIAQYEKEASTTVMVGRPAPPQGILMETYNAIVESANGLFGDIDNDLLTIQAAAFGKNVTNGLNTAKTVNFPLSTATNPLTQGMTMLMTDVMDNEIKPTDYVIVGNGLINNVYMQQQFNTQNTKDQNYPSITPTFYWDPYTTAKFGANQFGVFEKNAVQLVNINKFNGFIGGDKMSTFLFTLQLPVVDSSGSTLLQSFKFDAQLRHIDCPTEVQIGGAVDGEGDPVLTSVGRGWVLDLMANYTQINIASDAYDTDDRLTANNGTLRYTATNS
jgi:hypothetical protein